MYYMLNVLHRSLEHDTPNSVFHMEDAHSQVLG